MSEELPPEFRLYDTVRHKRTDGYYQIHGFPRTRVNGAWQTGVLYCILDDHTAQFVRPIEDFMEAFERVT